MSAVEGGTRSSPCFRYRDEVSEALAIGDAAGLLQKVVQFAVQPPRSGPDGGCSLEMDRSVRIEFEAVCTVGEMLQEIWLGLAHWAANAFRLFQDQFIGNICSIAEAEVAFFRRFTSDITGTFHEVIVIPVMMLTQSVCLLNYLVRRRGLGPRFASIHSQLWAVYRVIETKDLYPDFFLVQSRTSFYAALNDTIYLTSPWMVKKVLFDFSQVQDENRRVADFPVAVESSSSEQSLEEAERREDPKLDESPRPEELPQKSVKRWYSIFTCNRSN